MTPPEPDILEQLRAVNADPNTVTSWRDLVKKAADEIERLREDVQTWRDAYEAERQDHEATMKAWDEERSGW